MFDTEIEFCDYEYEQDMTVQDYERKGNVGIFRLGSDDADEDTYMTHLVMYRTPKVRSRQEIMNEQKRLLKLGIYEDDVDVVQQEVVR